MFLSNLQMNLKNENEWNMFCHKKMWARECKILKSVISDFKYKLRRILFSCIASVPIFLLLFLGTNHLIVNLLLITEPIVGVISMCIDFIFGDFNFYFKTVIWLNLISFSLTESTFYRTTIPQDIPYFVAVFSHS